MIHSMGFGRAFWLDEENEVCSAPWRKDGTVDMAQMDYVSEWTDLEGVDMYRLMDIIKQLINDKMNKYADNITTYAANITREQIKSGIKGNLLWLSNKYLNTCYEIVLTRLPSILLPL